MLLEIENLKMSELAGELKVYLMKYIEDIQYPIDIACQSIINKRKNSGLPYEKYERRYIDEYIGLLKNIENESMDKLNRFLENESDQLEKLGKDKILLQASCESVVYLENGDMNLSNQQDDEFVIGAFLRSPFWLNQNQANYIRVRLQDPDKSKNINIILDRVSRILNILKNLE